jgi:hypothetical protein
MNDLLFLFFSILTDLPFLIIYVIAVVLCLVRWQRHPRLSRLALCAFVLLSIRLVIYTGVRHWLLFRRLHEPSGDQQSFETYFAINTWFVYLTGLVAWVVLLVAFWKEALRLDPKLAQDHSDLGNALRATGRLQEALDHFDKALRLDPRQAQAHVNLGVALCDEGRLDDALGHFKEGIRIDPELAEAHGALARPC